MDRVRLAQLDIPPIAGASLEEVSDENSVRRYVARRGATLPGEIEIEVQAYAGMQDTTGYLIDIYEAPATLV